MALPSTGSISMSQVNTELKKSATAVISLNDANVRKLANKPSGTISMNDLRGKKNTEPVSNYPVFSLSFSADRETRNYTITFPHKVVSGNVFGNISYSMSGSCVFFGAKRYGNFKVSVPPGTVSFTISCNPGYEYDRNNNTIKGHFSISMNFTGEWEA